MKKETGMQAEELYKDDWPLFEKMLGMNSLAVVLK